MMKTLLTRIRRCTECKAHLPLGPRPVVQAHPQAKVLIVGQAPGRRVHETGVAWNDPSGDRLRDWLGISKEIFYDPQQVALVPMGFCYPGTGRSGDLPPRPECAPLWHGLLLKQLTAVRLTLLIGQYAQAYYLKDRNKDTLTHTIRAWRSYAPEYLPLPHPSPRNNLWLKKNPWFEREVLVYIRQHANRWLSKS